MNGQNYELRLRRIGERFHKNRRRAHLVLADISKMTGVSVATLSRFERGAVDSYTVTMRYKDALKALTGVSVSLDYNSKEG